MAKKPLTRKELILKALSHPETKMTCQELTKYIIKKQKLKGSIAHYLVGSISTILKDLVEDGVLQHASEKGPKGGYVFQLKNKELV